MPQDYRTLYVDIPAPLHRAAKLIATAEERLLRSVVTEALEQYVARRRAVGERVASGDSLLSTHDAGAEGPAPPGDTSPPRTKVPLARAATQSDEDEDLPPAPAGLNPFEAPEEP